MSKQDNTGNAAVMRVSAVSIAVNLLLSLCKLLAGIFAHSGAMVSDAAHSASDVLSTVFVMIGVRMAGKEPDKEHPYGHERIESLASLILAAVLAAAGLGIGYEGIRKILSGSSEIAVPGLAALIAAVFSVLCKEAMFQYTKRVATQCGSTALLADAWHHRSDALSSVGAFIGILGARLGFPVLDPLASAVICVFIEKAALDIFRDAADRMVDKACPPEKEAEIRQVILSVPDVIGIDDLKTRLFGAKIYVETEICVRADMTLIAAHSIAEQVHATVETHFPQVKHCMVHVNPDETPEEA